MDVQLQQMFVYKIYPVSAGIKHLPQRESGPGLIVSLRAYLKLGKSGFGLEGKMHLKARIKTKNRKARSNGC